MLHSQADKRRRIVYIQLGEQILSVAVDCQRADEQFLRYLGIGKAFRDKSSLLSQYVL